MAAAEHLRGAPRPARAEHGACLIVADPFVVDQVPVTIAQNTALSPEVDVGGKVLVGIKVPSSWVTAGISFQASIDGVTWAELEDQTATAISVASLTGGTQYLVAMDPTKVRGVRAIKVRSGTAASPVNQTASGGVALMLLTRFVF
jgi:hypothetical protein